MSTMDFILHYWHFNIFVVFGTLVLLFIHLIGNNFRLNRRSIYYFTALILFVIVTLSPIDFLAESYLFTAHMIKHITLLLIIPAFLLSGTDPAFLNRIVRHPSARRITTLLFHPVVAWFCGIGAMWIWHIPYLLGSEKTSPVLQVIHLISLLILGIIFNWPVFSPSEWRKLSPLQSALYLFTACVGCTVLGIFITFAPAGMYTRYFLGQNAAIGELVHQEWGFVPETDQQAGGLIMWVPACIIYLTDIMISLVRWYRSSEVPGSAS